MNDSIILHDKVFKPYLSYDKIISAIDGVAAKINADYEGCTDIPVLLCVLNGSIVFTGELMKRLKFNVELVSMKLTSYDGVRSTGKVRQVMGLSGSVKGKRVIVVEDIVDTGNTIVDLMDIVLGEGASDVRICTMLLKPEVYKKDVKLDYVGMEIPNAFIVGFGLDYNEIGRNYKDIYVLDPVATEQLNEKMKYYILFGPPGAGKGTQAAAMVEKYNLCHISTGELLRKEIAAGSELGLKAKALIDAGALVPDEVVEGMIENQFKTVKGVKGFLLDGFPRTIAQAEALDAMLAKNSQEVTSVVSIMIPDKMITERIKHRATIEGRADDANDATIANRIKTYHDKTEPLIGYYRKAGKYAEIDGTGSIEDVRSKIFATMDKF
ncbi:MAG: adenylate kinase [Bacteroidales bacterium]|nr:adenylate kinase [Bacteroidales bacterium]MCR5244171.1 adenylate kinase [Bacteroidales bacterium]MDT3355971.1 adenylate kinase [Bacteroidota bacterium]